MTNLFRKIIQMIMITVFLIPTFTPPVHAKTLGDLKTELYKKQEELNQNKQSQNMTQQQINSANAMTGTS